MHIIKKHKGYYTSSLFFMGATNFKGILFVAVCFI